MASFAELNVLTLRDVNKWRPRANGQRKVPAAPQSVQTVQTLDQQVSLARPVFDFEVVEAKIAFMGLDSEGKTALMRMLRFDRISETRSTLALGGVPFEAADLGGQESAQGLWKLYAAWPTGIVFCVDAADRASLPRASEELRRLIADPLFDHVPIAVLAQKSDVPQAVLEPELGQLLGLDPYPVSNIWKVRLFPCSLARGLGYDVAFEWLLMQTQATLSLRTAARAHRAAHTKAFFANSLLYTKFDASGLPTHGKDGLELRHSEIERCRQIALEKGLLLEPLPPTFFFLCKI
eukprot:TRINITY_DN8843_c0_g1_i2.p1 TRINITY_DN8843_c0_g1~~TRINITY_DN8843_c0_g1_i2.p1  ORF type:complete len:305 (-),score=48.59 TRINITY_DN8843_c0_g1_i2:170-1048(-)